MTSVQLEFGEPEQVADAPLSIHLVRGSCGVLVDCGVPTMQTTATAVAQLVHRARAGLLEPQRAPRPEAA
jgi:hypothetical protein